ncbi:glycoside hydrolase [Polyplosphaeria fusca]|uniref:Glycoside hydrolase n=1 Tax=Polyplosphaeria fusca TaxID=682080 RepID=A0A9P4V0R6_9PLEO|nr:glycoside hydrolase [Polyplosphaeria fusca]
MLLSTWVLATLLTRASALATSNNKFFKRQNGTGYELKTGPLDTDWTAQVGTDPWPMYPRPQLERSDWKNLNGVWRYQNISKAEYDSPTFNLDSPQGVLVPFCLESALSGIMGSWLIYSAYETTFEIPADWSKDNRVLLNFGAVDYKAVVYVNRKKVGEEHVGGYFEFTHDITSFLQSGSNELHVYVYDPTDMDRVQIPLGKQSLHKDHIFYVPCSGIWQTVWLESAPKEYITNFHMDADMDGKVNITIGSSGNGSSPVEVTVYELDSDEAKATGSGTTGTAFQFTVDSPKLWSPKSPTLYNLTIKLGDDEVKSYTGFRTVSQAVVDGIPRPLLNGEFIFWMGTLDQGFWPDGIYLAPTYDAMVYDLQKLQDIGYNMLRKHIKVEPALFYYAADKMGIMLIQDMPSLRTRVPKADAKCGESQPVKDTESQLEFNRELEVMIKQQRNYPSIVAWVIYNEGWGQADQPPWPEFELTNVVKSLDPTRLVDSVTGWFDHGAGDFHDNHKYANPQCGTPYYSTPSTPYDGKRIGFQGEFGGIGHNVSVANLWKDPWAIDHINQTYEIDADLDAWNYRAHVLLSELLGQVERYACSGAVWTQTTDVEGEVNGMLTYDRRILRPNLDQWNNDLNALYKAAAARTNGTAMMMPRAETFDGM